jgi:hypothetical protein
VQRRSLLHTFFTLAAVLTVLAWLMGALGVSVHQFFHNLCDTLYRHVAGEPNAWVLETLHCEELRRGIRGIGVAMQAANDKITDANARIDRAASFCMHRGVNAAHMLLVWRLTFQVHACCAAACLLCGLASPLNSACRLSLRHVTQASTALRRACPALSRSRASASRTRSAATSGTSTRRPRQGAPAW